MYINECICKFLFFLSVVKLQSTTCFLCHISYKLKRMRDFSRSGTLNTDSVLYHVLHFQYPLSTIIFLNISHVSFFFVVLCVKRWNVLLLFTNLWMYFTSLLSKRPSSSLVLIFFFFNFPFYFDLTTVHLTTGIQLPRVIKSL